MLDRDSSWYVQHFEDIEAFQEFTQKIEVSFAGAIKLRLKDEVQEIVSNLGAFRKRKLEFFDEGNEWWWTFPEAWESKRDYGTWFELSEPKGGPRKWIRGISDNCFCISLISFYGKSYAQKKKRDTIAGTIRRKRPRSGVLIRDTQYDDRVEVAYLPLYRIINLEELSAPDKLMENFRTATQTFTESLAQEIPNLT
jgi:hypothetical protein